MTRIPNRILINKPKAAATTARMEIRGITALQKPDAAWSDPQAFPVAHRDAALQTIAPSQHHRASLGSHTLSHSGDTTPNSGNEEHLEELTSNLRMFIIVTLPNISVPLLKSNKQSSLRTDAQ